MRQVESQIARERVAGWDVIAFAVQREAGTFLGRDGGCLATLVRLGLAGQCQPMLCRQFQFEFQWVCSRLTLLSALCNFPLVWIGFDTYLLSFLQF
jgi:hypothetical protein